MLNLIFKLLVLSLLPSVANNPISWENSYFMRCRFSINLYELDQIKGILHPKMKILSFFTYPYVVPNP